MYYWIINTDFCQKRMLPKVFLTKAWLIQGKYLLLPSNIVLLLLFVYTIPSGDLEPSQEDIRITEHLVEVGMMVGIPVLDHVILGSNEYTSFTDRGLL